jgi:7-cyano-7-deazaguanine synthase
LLFVDYGQPTAATEKECVYAWAQYFALPCFTNTTLPLWRAAALSGIDHSQDTMLLPQRNMHLLTIAAAYCDFHEIDIIVHGAVLDDYKVYADCRKNFFRLAQQILSMGRTNEKFGNDIAISLPAIELTKIELLNAVKDLDLPFDKTWSCYVNSGGLACGKCDSCKERKEAFEKVGIQDHDYAS